jgi:DNA primase
MGKTYLETIKYLIVADFQVDGLVEKPDVIGAIFGQSEGLLGSQLDIKDLQQNGKIGRIEITTSHNNNKTFGTLKLPCSLSMVETAIISASIESIDKVGPCDTRFTIKKIEDTRGLKRKQIKDRAIDLLGKLMQDEIPDTRELMDEIADTFKTKEIIFFGPDKLPAGPTIESNKELIIVEGRADVINMLKYGFTNVISTGGARIPSSLAEICKNKIVTLFLDGDRGADIQQNQLLRAVKVDYIARAPDGKEVEELTQKEINQALRRKIKSNFVLDLSLKDKNKNNYPQTVQPGIVKQTKFSTTNEHKVVNKPYENKPYENNRSYHNRPHQDSFKHNNFKTNNSLNIVLDIPDVERIDVSANSFSKPSFNKSGHNSSFKRHENRNDFKRSENKHAFKKPEDSFKKEIKNDFSNQTKITLKDRLENALKEFDSKRNDAVQENVLDKKTNSSQSTKTNLKEDKKEDVVEKVKKKTPLPKLTEKVKKSFLEILDEVDGKNQSRMLNEKLRRIGSSKSEDLLVKIKSFKTGKIYAVVTDLEINQEVLNNVKEKEIKFIVSPKSKIKEDSEINIITYNDLKK